VSQTPSLVPSQWRVAVLIVHWNTPELLERCLAALEIQTRLPDRVIVVDNGNSAQLRDAVSQRFPTAQIIRPGQNVGFAAANNLGIAAASDCDWCALLNPDTLPAPGWLEALLRAAKEREDCASFTSHMILPPPTGGLDGVGDVYHVSGSAWRRRSALAATESWSPFSACAAAALYRRQALLDIEGFDEDFFCYVEDVDLGFRLRLAGHECAYVPNAVVLHEGSASTGGQHSDFAVYYGHRNLVWAWVKNMPAPLLWRSLPQHLLFNLAALLSFSMRGQARVIWKAKWDALKGLAKMRRKRMTLAKGRDWRALRAQMDTGWLTPYRRMAASGTITRSPLPPSKSPPASSPPGASGIDVVALS
jgi:GT2 family glycosyltransferase